MIPLFYLLYFSYPLLSLWMDRSNNPCTKNFFPPLALSLSLAGVYRRAAPVEEEVEEGDEESVGGSRGEEVEISSENTGPGGRSEEDADTGGLLEAVEVWGRKKRKKYHRHTAEQIREMEALFKESPHPDEKQRQQLSEKLGLASRQVKFWFQNRRTQNKAVQERHENSILKAELDKLCEENRCMRETIKNAYCRNCGFSTSNKDTTMTAEEQMLRIENVRSLKAEIEKLRRELGRSQEETASPSSPCSGGNDQTSAISLDRYSEFLGVEKCRILEIVNHALDELMKMATAHEPLWVRSVESGREILNYDEYVREFSPEFASNRQMTQSIEASRATGIVFLDISRLIQAYMDVNRWKGIFACMVSRAATVDIIFNGQGSNKNGAVQLMFAELQMLTPLVPTRELHFIRHCKQLSPDRWAIVDVSMDKIEEINDISQVNCWKRPSGCIIDDQFNGHCKVIWVEHMECQKSTIPIMYRSIVNNGLAFGAQHWMSTLQVQCGRIVFSMATNVPTKDSNGISTLAGRRSILKLAERMTSSFCCAISASRYRKWTKVTSKGGEDIRYTSRKNISDPWEPLGLILCAVSSTWLSIPSTALFDFLRDDTKRTEWDIMLNGGHTKSIVNLATGQDRGNSVTLNVAKPTERASMLVLQDNCTSAYDSMVVYAPVDVDGMQLVMTGRDSSNLALLPSGFSILPDGFDTRPLVITSRPEERSMGGGSLLTTVIQILADTSPVAKLTAESVKTISTLISCTLLNIKKTLQCEDG